jgi:ankyrin repeat protein
MAPRRILASAVLLGLLLPAGAALASPDASDPDTRLIEAVKSGDQSAVKTLLRQRGLVNGADGDGSTALHWAAYEDNLPLAKLLLAARADVNAVTRLQAVTPLFMACQSGSAAMIKLLVEHGANPNQANSLGTTPLMMAAASGSVAAVEALVAHGAQVNAREQTYEQTALMFAANLDRADAVRALIAHGADANLASKIVPATLYVRPPRPAPAASSGDNKAAARRPADDEDDMPAPDAAANAARNGAGAAGAADPADAARQQQQQQQRRDRGAQLMGGMTPLLFAARQGNVAATRALLEGGASIDTPSGGEKTTPLVLAIANGHYDVARVLVEHGADVNQANIMGLAPLYATVDVQWAQHQWSPEPVVEQEHTNYLVLMQMLIDHGADVNARLGRMPWFRTLSQSRVWTEMGGSTAFWRAAAANDVQAMQLLKQAGADMTIATTNGTTPLMAAAGVGWAPNYSTTAPTRMEAVQFMLATGADVNQVDSLGLTAMHGAGFVGDLRLIQALADLGARTNVKTKAGDYPADYANGPFEKSLPIPEAVALLEKLGSPNSNNCRSSDCVPPEKEDRAVAGAAAPAAAGRPPAPAATTLKPAG